MESKYNADWNNVRLFVGDVEIKSVSSITYIKTEKELQQELNKALEIEDYLEAAKLRDQIQSLKK